MNEARKMSLRQKQSKFAHMASLLILHAEALGFDVTLGEAYRHSGCQHGHPRSLHKSRLAIDLNLFRSGRYLTAGKHHSPLHDYWDSIGGSERIEADMNHYSLGHGGMR